MCRVKRTSCLRTGSAAPMRSGRMNAMQFVEDLLSPSPCHNDGYSSVSLNLGNRQAAACDQACSGISLFITVYPRVQGLRSDERNRHGTNKNNHNFNRSRPFSLQSSGLFGIPCYNRRSSEGNQRAVSERVSFGGYWHQRAIFG
ncbi:hypothetical protein TNCV_5025031 [Trichonephila clavipes]|nr:hypothetical protein TNCV_5025031 [Trichonephila clavipes]